MAYDIIKKPPAWPVVFLIILLQDVCSCLPFLKCPLVLTDCGHPVHISMPDRIVKSGNNLFFPAKEVWPGQICCDRMVCDERTVTVQVLNELYAVTNQNGYLVNYAGDGAPVVAEAFARLKFATA